MNLHRLLEVRQWEGKPLRVGLIGAGKFGRMYLAQIPAAWDNFRNIQTKDAKYVPFIGRSEQPAIDLNRKTMQEFAPAMQVLLRSGTLRHRHRAVGPCNIR